MKKIIIFLGLIALFCFLLFGKDYYASFRASLTYREKTQEIGDGGFGNSLYLRGNGSPVISYITKDNRLVFKERIQEEWKEEVIDDNVLAGSKTKISLDDKDTIYILYIKDNSLQIARKGDLGWDVEKVFDDASLSCDLTIINNIIYVSFWSPKNGLGFGKKEKNKWDIKIIDYGKVGWWNSLVVDNEGNFHLSYFDFENKDLLYLYFDGTRWQKEVVDSVGEVGFWNSLAITQNGNIYISYFDQNNGKLKFAKKTKGGWQTEIIDREGIIGERTNIILDKNDSPIISYVGLSDNSFRVAKKNGNSWNIKIISKDNEATSKNIKGEGVLDNSIFINSENAIFLLWQNLFKNKLNYLETNL